MLAGVASFGSQRCVPARNPAITTANQQCNAGTALGVAIPGILNGSCFGSQPGHVFVGQDDALDFIQTNSAPEPATFLLVGSGLLMVGYVRRRRA